MLMFYAKISQEGGRDRYIGDYDSFVEQPEVTSPPRRWLLDTDPGYACFSVPDARAFAETLAVFNTTIMFMPYFLDTYVLNIGIDENEKSRVYELIIAGKLKFVRIKVPDFDEITDPDIDINAKMLQAAIKFSTDRLKSVAV